MKKIRLHPLFILLCITLAIFSQFKLLYLTMISVIVHELAHFVVARKLGYRLDILTLMPYGAVLSGEGINSEDIFAVAIAGPLINFFIAIVIVAFWWIYPSSYHYTLLLFRSNMTIGLFNLLPLYPLDGGKIVLSFCRNKIKGLKVLKLANVAVSILLMGLFVATAFFQINFTLGVAAIMLFAGGMADIKKEKYSAICYSLKCLTNFEYPVKKTIYCTHINAKVAVVVRYLRNKGYFILEVLDNNFMPICTLSDYQLDMLFALPKQQRKQTMASYLTSLGMLS